MRSGYVTPYFKLDQDARCDVVVIGGGISGALAARALAVNGVDVIVVDRRHVGMGSTSASTALIQYDIDKTLHELIEIRGEKVAVRAYEMSLQALLDLEDLAAKIAPKCNFSRMPGYRFGRFKKDIPFIEKEYEARKASGFDVQYFDDRSIAERFPFATAALRTEEAAIADPYMLTHAVLQDAVKNGTRIFDKTCVKNIERRKRSVVVHCDDGPKITAKKIVIACGYETVNYLPKGLCDVRSTYALISEPMGTDQLWYENAPFWTCDDPYLYGRTTSEGRVIFGGEDEAESDPGKRDAMLSTKTKKLENKFRKLFPHISLRTDYAWAGTFVETEDGLPLIGSMKGLDHTFFALGYGGNGITFSQLAAGLITDMILGQKNPDSEMFAFDR